ncbi:hypothetical protein F8O06_09710 [Pseudoclavibacter sp. CFCC 14310]|uniref:tubulin-like doman-containing protein n=1 Tax=Pseudoclavibacter sp. CFCC 14310 TaxID=2615180 RepID=UPI001301904D|nr:tubulin-like doman-containing protein [Pseudoclavibacter sp. CFCC 14310]KAB1644320.1 hypothetical protein F8O06_09710 [Pseudoclavibacter sp. CFCC 14310]
MYKFLVVGCGGSGGSTLAYMMDQLKAQLRPAGFDRLPGGWKFVHIDVPNAPDTRIGGIGNVRTQGGSYISTAPQSGTFGVLDNALSKRLADNHALGEYATWAPRAPEQITVPIGNGAGQMRAVGRAITLARATSVFQGLSQAVQELNTVEANNEMQAVALAVPSVGKFDSASRPVVLVVSSMAGGAGASMALDVCRILSLVPGIDPGLVGVFMVTPDVFDQLPSSARGGVRANALAMLGEIIATQAGSAEEHDVKILSALGLQVERTHKPPFGRVFPVGRSVGAEKTLFGDGSQQAVYRGLGRGLAALMSSGKASGDFVEFDLVNASDPTPADPDFIGWGTPAGALPWGAFGFATLSMGRDRYRHYAAQRLSHFAVDRLREGHLQPGNTASSLDQLRRLAEATWGQVVETVQLPLSQTGQRLSPNQMAQWISSTAYSPNQVAQDSTSIVQELSIGLPPAAGDAKNWAMTVSSYLGQRRGDATSAVAREVYQWAFNWSASMHQHVLDAVTQGVQTYGLPYGRELAKRLERAISDEITPVLGEVGSWQVSGVGTLPQGISEAVAKMKGTIANGPAMTNQLQSELQGQVREMLYVQASAMAKTVLEQFAADVLRPLQDSISETLALLDQAVQETPSASGLANVATEQYVAWPTENDERVPERFGVADNEILLTPVETFSQQFAWDLPSAIDPKARAGNALPLQDALQQASQLVISGLWPVASGRQAPGGLIETQAQWRPAVLNRDPISNSPLTPSEGHYRYTVKPSEVLERALAFVGREGESFEQFCSVSLKEYALGRDINEAQRPQRRQDLIEKFGQTLARALPLSSINSDVVNAVHGTPTQYRYKFSSIPFTSAPSLVEDLEKAINGRQNLADEVQSIFKKSLTDDENVTSIDVFGSYRNYSPLVFDALLTPVAQQWAGTSAQGRHQFWDNRRSRPLAAAIPAGRDERHTMIAGWYVGQLIGELKLPQALSDPVEIWDPETRAWTHFPNPLLTPPGEFLGQSIDWMPAVLESYLLAISRAHEAPVLHSLRPYQLLRRLSDSNQLGPAQNLVPREAKVLLGEWMRDGSTRSGADSRVAGATPEERAEQAKTWLTTIRTYTAENFVPTGTSHMRPGAFSEIPNRRVASATPIFRDLAQDILAVTKDLIELLPAALQRATTAAEQHADVSNLLGDDNGGASAPLLPDSGLGAF